MSEVKPRVITLLPSATEIVCALGFEHLLVGRSHECDFPESVKRLVVCTAPKFDVVGSSQEIDRRVRQLVTQGLSVYAVDEARLRQLKPDLIITQSQCEVCAASLEDVERAVCELLPSRPQILALEPRTLSDIWEDIQRVADALSSSERGFELVGELWNRVDAIASAARSSRDRPVVCCVEWLEPLMVAGNWIPEMVELAGGYYPYAESGSLSRRIEWNELAEKNPDVILIAPCGFSIDRSLREIDKLTSHPLWSRLKAARAGRCYVADGNHYFNRPGPRIVDALEMLAEIIGPERFEPKKWEGKGYKRI